MSTVAAGGDHGNIALSTVALGGVDGASGPAMWVAVAVSTVAPGGVDGASGPAMWVAVELADP